MIRRNSEIQVKLFDSNFQLVTHNYPINRENTTIIVCYIGVIIVFVSDINKYR